MTLLRKLYLAFGSLSLLVVIVGGIGVYSNAQLVQKSNDLINGSVEVAEAAATFRGDGLFLNASARGLVLFPEKQAIYSERVNTAHEQLTKSTAALSAIASDPAYAATVTKIVDSANKTVALTTQLEDAVGAGDSKTAMSLLEQSVTPATELADGAGQLSAQANQRVAEAQAELATEASRAQLILVLFTLAAVAAAVAVSVIVGRTVSGTIRDLVNTLTRSAAGLLAVSSQVSASSAETGSSIVETTTTVREVKQTAFVATQKAAEMREASEETARIADQGAQSVEQTIQGIRGMAEQMDSITDSIVRLSDQTTAIADVITTVKDLAEQSNLLSVNAAIEAAKAGDQGKGFAVVAQEVKNLADQSKLAVAQVRDILTDIQKATTTAVLAAELGNKAIESGSAQSRESGEAIKKLAESVAGASTLMRQTAASAEQQLAGMDQINTAIEAINEASKQNVEGSRQVQDEVRSLQGVTDRLKALLERTSDSASGAMSSPRDDEAGRDGSRRR